MKAQLRVIAEKAFLRNAIAITPETRMIAAIFGQALLDLHGGYAQPEDIASAKRVLTGDYGTHLAGLLGLDDEQFRAWINGFFAWLERRSV